MVLQEGEFPEFIGINVDVVTENIVSCICSKPRPADHQGLKVITGDRTMDKIKDHDKNSFHLNVLFAVFFISVCYWQCEHTERYHPPSKRCNFTVFQLLKFFLLRDKKNKW